MKISVILGHPDINSFNYAIADTVVKVLRNGGHEVLFHDLYREDFPPVIPVEEIPKDVPLPDIINTHCREIVEVEGIIIIHPNWWGQPPAILKGWIDRIIRPGVAYQFEEGDSGEGVPTGLLRTRAALIFTTSNTYAERERSVFGDPLETIWKNCIFDLCGVKTFCRRNFEVVVTSTPEQRQEWLQKAAETALRYFPPENKGSSS
ncbi:MAG: NAD(P)H-dependent oxidoreductase [Dehalococcoidales bacterium]|nr:MAG: NAD(P)H-dependent oxidoreductase [Dehalococcoidales bacterium]